MATVAMLSVVLLSLSAAAATITQAQRGDASAACVSRGGGSKAKRGEICYEFFDEETVWVDARARCREYNASLVSVISDDVQRWLETAVENLLPDRVGVWIGLNDRRDEGTYVWDDVGNTDREAQYFNWHIGEPNDINLGQDCVYMRKTFKWQWVDVECALPLRRYSFVCEFGPRTIADHRFIKEENSLPARIPSVAVSSANISRVTQVTGPKRVSSLELGTGGKTTIGKSYSLKSSLHAATSTMQSSSGSGHLQNGVNDRQYDESQNLPQSALQDVANSDSKAFNHSSWFAAVLAIVLLVGGALLAYFLVYRNPSRLARLKAAAATTLGRRCDGRAAKTAVPAAKHDVESKTYLLAEAKLQSSGAVRQETRSNNGGGGGGRAVPNIYVALGEATAALPDRPGCGGSDDAPLYADLVEPLPQAVRISRVAGN